MTFSSCLQNVLPYEILAVNTGALPLSDMLLHAVIKRTFALNRARVINEYPAVTSPRGRGAPRGEELANTLSWCFPSTDSDVIISARQNSFNMPLQ